MVVGSVFLQEGAQQGQELWIGSWGPRSQIVLGTWNQDWGLGAEAVKDEMR